MKRKTSNRFQGDFFSALVPATSASAAATDGTDTDVQPSADLKSLQNQPIEQASMPGAVSMDAVEPMCRPCERIAAHADPDPGAGQQVAPFRVRPIIDTAIAHGSNCASVAPEHGLDQRGNDDVSGSPTLEASGPGLAAVASDRAEEILGETVVPAAASTTTGDSAGDRKTPGIPGTVDAEPVQPIFLEGHQTEGSHWTVGSPSPDVDAGRIDADWPDHLNVDDEHDVVGELAIADTRCAKKVALAERTSIEELLGTASTDGVDGTPRNDPDKRGKPAIESRNVKCLGQDSQGPVVNDTEMEDSASDEVATECRLEAKGGETSIPKMSPPSADGLIGVSGKSVGETESLPHGEDMTNHVNPVQNGLFEETQSSKPARRGRKPMYDELPYHFAISTEDGIVKPIPRHVYFRMVNDLIEGDQNPLRKLWQLAELEKTNIVSLSLKKHSLAALLTKHKLHRNPKRFAGQILICFKRLVECHPTLLTIEHEQVVDTRVHPLPEDRVPQALRDDIAAWLAKVPVKVKGSRNVTDALEVDTIESYVRNVHTIAAGLALSGVRLDHTVDIAFLIQRSAIMRWLKYLKKSMKRSTLRGLIASLLRIATDLPNKSEADIEFLRARLHDYMGEPALDGDELARLAKWVEPEKHRCLLSAPHQLMEAAENSRKWPASRMLDSGAAFAFILMWEHPGLSEAAIAAFDLATHIVGEPGSREVLRFREARGREPSKWVGEPLSAEAEGILDRLIALRASMSVTTTLLLPGEDGRPRRVSSAMEVMYTKIQGILAERLNSSDLRDLNAYIALDDKSADLAEIADGLGYKNARSLERRFGEHARRTSLTSGEA